jgi:uncharacterized protein YndB with AHSA1/START domain
MNVAGELTALGGRLAERFDGIDEGPMLRATALRHHGRSFAFARDDALVVKLPAAAVAAAVARGATPFRSGRRVLREWVAFPMPRRAEVHERVVASHGYVAHGHGAGDDYAATLAVDASAASVYRALTTAEGIAAWWTRSVEGEPAAPGGIVELGFGGLDERIVLEVVEAEPEREVVWRCAEHGGHAEWAGTTISFTLVATGDEASVVRLFHAGLRPTLTCFDACRRGWEHFAPSLAAVASGGVGSPFGSLS